MVIEIKVNYFMLCLFLDLGRDTQIYCFCSYIMDSITNIGKSNVVMVANLTQKIEHDYNIILKYKRNISFYVINIFSYLVSKK